MQEYALDILCRKCGGNTFIPHLIKMSTSIDDDDTITRNLLNLKCTKCGWQEQINLMSRKSVNIINDYPTRWDGEYPFKLGRIKREIEYFINGINVKGE
jgi:hypothetical protein